MNNPNPYKSSFPLGSLRRDFFPKLRSQHERKFPFVVYRKPNETKAKALLQRNKEIFHTKNFTEEGFVFASFDSDDKSILIPISQSDELEFDYGHESNNENNVGTERTIIHLNKCMNEIEKHLLLVQKGIGAIKSGKLEKVVLSRKQEVQVCEENPLCIFQKLVWKHPAAFVYCWFHPATGFWLGATPETLLQVENGQMKTMALAGTQKYNGTVDVLWGEKEREEQQLVTDFIVSALKGKVENLKISTPETIKAGSLLHLRTNFSGKLKDNNLKEIIHDLHPTPAVCGIPKKASKNFILANETYDREFYTGFLGELNMKVKKERMRGRGNQENKAYAAIKKQSNLFVNLRCMKLQNGKANLYMGGGITAESDPKCEWEETMNKAETMLDVL